MNTKLKRYNQKRDFAKTTEPSDQTITVDWADGQPFFVIQKHAASTLHYDFRIEVDGVLKSWAVPKGPSTDLSIKRLAVPTEDHPLAYADFEGVIPEGEYGGGTVMLWDRGPYRNLKVSEVGAVEKTLEQQLEDGHVTIWLEGQKLQGGYALIRTGSGDKARWLLIKMDDSDAAPRRKPTETEALSVKTGRTMDEIRMAGGKGRIFLDTLRNSYGATAVAPYAVRARPEASVATPVDWSEVEAGVNPRDWTIQNLPQRMTQRDDPWKDLSDHPQNLQSRWEKLRKLINAS